jgi:hypothetical protein
LTLILHLRRYVSELGLRRLYHSISVYDRWLCPCNHSIALNL